MVKFIDLFSGMGGFRLGLEQAADSLGIQTQCLFSSEIKPHALSVYQENFGKENIYGDITQIPADDIPDFDILLAGFPVRHLAMRANAWGSPIPVALCFLKWNVF